MGTIPYCTYLLYLSVMKSLVKLIFLLLLISGCRKDGPLYDGNCSGDCVILTGKLVVQQTGMGLPGVDLKFNFKGRPTGFGAGKTDFLGVSQTRADGVYFFSIPKEYFLSAGNNGVLVISASPPNYVNAHINEDEYLAGINFPLTDSLVTIDLHIWKASPLKVRVKTGSITSFDQFYFTQTFGGAYSFNNTVKGRRSFDTTFNKVTASDIPTYIIWKTRPLGYNSSGAVLSGSDSVIVAAGSSGDVFIQLP